MDLMDDEGLRRSVIDQMLGETDDLTAQALKKGPVKGVEIAITVSPKTGDHEEPDGDEATCMEPGCEDPMHDHSERDGGASQESPDYISDLLKKLG